MDHKFQMSSLGAIKKKDTGTCIEIQRKYMDGLLGLNQFSHIIVFYWFHQNDLPEKRVVLQVHPRGNQANPLTGIFATRSPLRPNLIGMSVCRVLSVSKNIIHIDEIDAFNETPVIDIKPYLPGIDRISDTDSPGWAKSI